jgi:hypothetical protein
LNVEGKLAKILGKDTETLVVKASDRDTVLNEISARIARVEKFDPEAALELRALRNDVKDVFNKGLDPGDDILEALWFLDPKTRDLVEVMSKNYTKVITPMDFKIIANIMSEHLSEQVPILKDFTRFFGRLAEEFLIHSKPSESAMDWKKIASIAITGTRKSGYRLPPRISEFFGLNPNESLKEKTLKRLSFWKPDSPLADILFGNKQSKYRRTGTIIGGKSIVLPSIKIKLEKFKHLRMEFFKSKDIIKEMQIFYTNKLPKRWTNIPWVNFDGKVVEQNFTQTFEERIFYKDKFGNWTTNILQVPQKTEATWWEQVINKSGKINDIADSTKARTAYAVNGIDLPL